mgnify:CR=1 FL=1
MLTVTELLRKRGVVGKILEPEIKSLIDARKAMRLASAKLPIKTKFATRFTEEKAS